MYYNTDKNKVIKMFVELSDKYHKMSLLFYELSQSLRIESENKNDKEFRTYIKSLNLDIDKIKALNLGINNVSLNDLKKEKKWAVAVLQ